MKPMSSFLGLRLRTAVKVVCKSVLLLVSTSFILNVTFLDYRGRREESIMSLGVVFFLYVILTLSAFVGHSGAHREGLCLLVFSLSLLLAAIIHWFCLGILSMQKSQPGIIWQVCIQNRCAETFWTMNFGYRDFIGHSNNGRETRKEPKMLPRHWKISPSKIRVDGLFSDGINQSLFNTNNEIQLANPYFQEYDGNEEWPIGFESNRTPTLRPRQQPIEFWQRFTQNDYESTDPTTGISLVVTLCFFLLGTIYFFTCATVICSYCSELYENYRADNDIEDEDQEAGGEQSQSGQPE